jgi:hypothetical protein
LEDQREQLRREELDAALSGWRAQENALVEDQADDAPSSSHKKPRQDTSEPPSNNVIEDYEEGATFLRDNGFISLAMPFVLPNTEDMNGDLRRVVQYLMIGAMTSNAQYATVSTLLAHYLGALNRPDGTSPYELGTAMYLPFSAFQQTDDGPKFQLKISEEQRVFLSANMTVNNGQVSVNGNWLPVNERFTGVMVFALGTVTLRPNGEIVISNITVTGNTITGTITQSIELYDFYDWDGTPYSVNPTTGTVRFPAFTDATTGTSYPTLELDVATNTVTAATGGFDDNDYTVIIRPPDAADLGQLVTAYTSGSASASIFGTPDHPAAFEQANRKLGSWLPWLQFSNTEGLYAGEFLNLEANGQAQPFEVYSSWTQSSEFVGTIQPNGQVVIIISAPTLVGSPITNTQWTSMADYQPMSLSESGYTPSTPQG